MKTVPVVLISALVALIVHCDAESDYARDLRMQKNREQYSAQGQPSQSRLPQAPALPPQKSPKTSPKQRTSSGSRSPVSTLPRRPTGVTAWYIQQGFPIPVYNRFALGYKKIHGVGKFKVHREGRSWRDALDICVSEGSLLAVINDAEEAEILRTMILGASDDHHEVATSGMYYYWIGAKEFGTNKKFLTLHGNTLGRTTYLRWSPSYYQPDDPGNYDCVGFMHDGYNFDAGCDECMGFICEKVT